MANPSPPLVQRLAWNAPPADLVARWPADRALFALLSSPAIHASAQRRARWSILASPLDGAPRIAPRAGDNPLALLDRAIAATARSASPAVAEARAAGLPFLGGWIGAIDYELGEVIEPNVRADASHSPGPLLRFVHCDAALVHDAAADRWWAVGEPDAASGLIRIAAQSFVRSAPGRPRVELDPPRSNMGRAAYEAAVRRAVELIHAGDAFQVNLAHHLVARLHDEPRALFLALLERAAPDYGALLEHRDADRQAVLSISPELFLEADFAAGADRRVLTRPIKGTRRAIPTDPPAARAALERSEKDRAELVMIVDLMRNDLGRVCEFGSVRVESDRDIEPHAGGELLHAVATVSGRLRADITPAALLRAAFPPGSVTGAPKVRAMQIIRELEPAPRAAYCGAVGFFSDHGRASLSVAIRTATVRSTLAGAEVSFPVGAGVVADSDPHAEWLETLDKAGAFTGLPAPLLAGAAS